jgi:flagellar hook-basal body complex protein FliE
MIAPIQPVQPGIVTGISLPSAEPSSPGEFRDLLTNSMASIERQQNEATTAVNQFLSGEGGELHSVALAQQRASLSMDLFLQVRNKVISAYQEVMKMQM